MERFNVKRLNNVELEHYQVKIPNRFTALKNLGAAAAGNDLVWKTLREVSTPKIDGKIILEWILGE
jgi:hypothetical protein